MSHRTGTRAAAVVAAVVIGVYGFSWRAAAQGEAKAAAKITPALLLLSGEPEDRPADFSRSLATLLFEARTTVVIQSALSAHPEIVAQPEVARQKDPVRWVSEAVRIEPIPGTDFIQISCQAGTSQLAASIANAVADAFLRHTLDRRIEALDVRLKVLDEARLQDGHRTAALRQALHERMKSAGDGNASAMGATPEADELREIRKELRRVRLERVAAEVRREREKTRSQPLRLAELSDSVAALAAQEQLLVKDEQAGIEALRRAEVAALEFQAARDDLARAEQHHHAVEDDLRRLRVSMLAPTILKYSPARPAD